ncbi:MAG: FHA domain-containing protein [Acidimicrobiales bacterium]|nr:FHA domain-containing protein [Acidimicrobiales bacterium]
MGASCPNCGYDNPLGSNFCSSCGGQLRATVNSETERILVSDAGGTGHAADSGEAVLVVRQGPKRGSRIALDADVISIGRGEDSDIFLDDITVSRNHARLDRVGTGFRVSDQGSLNGTYVNKELIEEAMLADGDEVQVGKFKLVYLALGGEQ